ncbi:MAG: ergothioneine biosynthesis protein EgtB [Oscillatoriaceae cyanobacterium]
MISTSTTSRDAIASALSSIRDRTLQLFEGINDDHFRYQFHPDFSPIGWHLGHIGYTEALWFLQHLKGDPPIFPQYQQLFSQAGLPKHLRVHLPPFPEVCQYLEKIRVKVWDYLQIAPLEEQERLWHFIIQHECQHAETIALVLACGHQERNSGGSVGAIRESPLQTKPEMIEIPAGEFQMGWDGIAAIDNERPAHPCYLHTYRIDKYPVTRAQYREFIAAGGYTQCQYWSKEGWEWLQTAAVSQPLYWSEDPTKDNYPVCGVSYYEAEAYAKFVGKRLPTEAEWEKAALTPTGVPPRQPSGLPGVSILQGELGLQPIGTDPETASIWGCEDLFGQVWQWTDSWFEGYAGFQPYPYPGYSQTYFDGKHRVLRGSSWATLPQASRSTWRNWYQPWIREIFAGFRCASS